jgi:hypothetical protein
MSAMRVSSVCSPLPVTATSWVSPGAEAATPSRRQSTWSTPECASVPCTVTVSAFCGSQAEVAVVVSVGVTVSMRIVCVLVVVSPMPSVSVVTSVWTPLPDTVTGAGPAPATSPVIAPLSRSHWIRTTPEPPLSVPVTLIVVEGAVTQPDGTHVVSTGPLMSTCTVRVVHGEAIPTLSTTRVLSVWEPCWVTETTVPLAPLPGTPSSSHSTRATPEWASLPWTVTSTA